MCLQLPKAHPPTQCTDSVGAGISKCLGTTVRFLQLLESVFRVLKAKRLYEATLIVTLLPAGYASELWCIFLTLRAGGWSAVVTLASWVS